MRARCEMMSNSLRAHLVTDQVPLLLVVVLSEEPGFVWRQVHGILKNKTETLASFTATYCPVFCLTEHLRRLRQSLWRQQLNFGDLNNDLTSCVDCQHPARRGDLHFLRAPKSHYCSDVS